MGNTSKYYLMGNAYNIINGKYHLESVEEAQKFILATPAPVGSTWEYRSEYSFRRMLMLPLSALSAISSAQFLISIEISIVLSIGHC